jgi:hypothetical protein
MGSLDICGMAHMNRKYLCMTTVSCHLQGVPLRVGNPCQHCAGSSPADSVKVCQEVFFVDSVIRLQRSNSNCAVPSIHTLTQLHGVLKLCLLCLQGSSSSGKVESPQHTSHLWFVKQAGVHCDYFQVLDSRQPRRVLKVTCTHT